MRSDLHELQSLSQEHQFRQGMGIRGKAIHYLQMMTYQFGFVSWRKHPLCGGIVNASITKFMIRGFCVLRGGTGARLRRERSGGYQE